MRPLTVYTDGACWQGEGGWAWYVHEHLWDSGHSCPTTNNRMELEAVIRALEAMRDERPGQPLLLVSDSAYFVNCIAEGWYVKWRRNGWTNAEGEPVKNQRYWQRLLEVWEHYPDPVTFRHCRGHGRGGVADTEHVFGNNKADRLAVAARKMGHGKRDREGGTQ